jgi:TonB-linked SusC/RagA family outer membrane protein
MTRGALLLLPFLLALTTARPAAAQGHVVAGVVTSTEDGLPLPGVNVLLQGTATGAATDAQGRYTLTVPSPEGVLVFSFVGYETQEVPIAGRSEVNVALAPVSELLDDVVVIGYGEASRRRLASATSSVEAEDLEAIPVAGVDAAIQGKTAGVTVVQNSGTPGSGITVRVRGHSSIDASNQPLYVIDGVPMLSEDFSQLAFGGQDISAVTGVSPADIASVDVLKDAAAIAIYGARGANGVVMITTKRGQAGRPHITFDSYVGTQDVTRTLDLLSGREYVAFMNQAALNDDSTDVLAFGDPDTVAVDTDWQREVFREAPVQSYELGVSGGDARVRYYLSGSYYDQVGVVLGSGYDRINARANLDLHATDRLFIESSLGLARESNLRIEGDNTIRGALPNAIANQPFIPVYRPDGAFTGLDDGLAYVNGIAIGTYNHGEALTYRALGNVRAEYRLLDDVYLNARLGADVLNLREYDYRSPLVQGDYAESVDGIVQSAYNTATQYVAEGYATYEPAFGRHDLALTGGASFEVNDLEWNFIEGTNLGDTYFENVINAGTISAWDGSRSEHNLVSFFARANYLFDERYIVSASLRADGSSRFAPNNRFGVFPAVAVAWRADQEPFMRALAGEGRAVSDLKLRASYGVIGNESIGNYTWRDLWGTVNYGDETGLAPEGTVENLDLGWESTAQANLGLDLGLFGGRVSLVADAFDKRTTDLLVFRDIPYTSGGSGIQDNVGEISNRGVEFLLHTVNVRPRSERGFRWETSLNFSHYRNEVVELYDDQPLNAGRSGVNRVEEGQPLGAFYMYAFVGVDPATGNALFEDVETGGTCVSPLTAEAFPDAGLNACTEDDRQIVGSPHPDFTAGLTNELSFAGLDLSVFVYASVGNEIYHGNREFSDDGGDSGDNKLQSVMDAWQQPGDVTDVPRASLDGSSGAAEISSRFLEDGSFLRVKSVTLGYRLPERLVGNAGVRSARLYVSAQNLLTVTDFTGLDPEVNFSGSGSNVALGTEFYTYPQPRIVLIGLQLGL